MWATGDEDPASPGKDPWSQMAKPGPDLIADQKRARDIYAQAFGNASVWQPSAKAATVGPTTIGRDDLGAKRYQDDNNAMLGSIATGGAGGIAESTARANLGTAQANNNALAAGQVSPNSMAMAMRSAGNANAGMMQGNEAKIAAMRAQEQKAAESALYSGLASSRSQSYGVASDQAKMNAAAGMANAGFATQTGLANQDAYLRGESAKRAALAAQYGFDQSVWENGLADAYVNRGDARNMDEVRRRQRESENTRNAQVANTGGQWVAYGSNHNVNATNTGGKG